MPKPWQECEVFSRSVLVFQKTLPEENLDSLSLLEFSDLPLPRGSYAKVTKLVR